MWRVWRATLFWIVAEFRDGGPPRSRLVLARRRGASRRGANAQYPRVAMPQAIGPQAMDPNNTVPTSIRMLVQANGGKHAATMQI